MSIVRMLSILTCVLASLLFMNETVLGQSNADSALTVQTAPSGPELHLTGKLTDFTGEPLANVKIGIANADGHHWQPLSDTRQDGSFEARLKLQYGEYLLIAAIGEFELDRWSLFWSTRENGEIHTERTVTARRQSDDPPVLVPPAGLLNSPGEANAPAEIVREAAQSRSVVEGPLHRTEPAPQEAVSVFYATNRKMLNPKTGEFADDLSADGMHYGVSLVHMPPVHQLGKMERPTIWRLERSQDPAKHIVITSTKVYSDAAEFRHNLHHAFQQGASEAFLFVHGYNVDFQDSVMWTAQMYRDLHFNGVPILFSWPAQSAWWRYLAAEDAVDESALQLHHFLLEMIQSEKLTAVTVIAHSLGNRILAKALERLQAEHTRLALNNIVMAAPDINAMSFGGMATAIASSARHTTIYSSSSDLALKVSKTFHSYPRLGEAPPARTYAGIDIVDASAIHQDLLGHSYLDDSKQVLNDLFLLVVKGLTPDRRSLVSKSITDRSKYWLIPDE